MNPETHHFEQLDTPQAFESAESKGWKIFKTGEKVTLNGTDFTVVDIQPTKLVLRPFGLGLTEATPAPLGEQPAHQQRVLVEKFELDEKIAKLASFLNGGVFAGLDEEEQDLLNTQIECMRQYSLVLQQRIAAFGL